jgi:hypothetical protein
MNSRRSPVWLVARSLIERKATHSANSGSK